MAYLIEKNVPVPTIGGRGTAPKFPFRQLEVGDSFVVPSGDVRWGKHTEGGRPINGVCQLANYYQRKYGAKFTVRTLADRSVRVWRIA